MSVKDDFPSPPKLERTVNESRWEIGLEYAIELNKPVIIKVHNYGFKKTFFIIKPNGTRINDKTIQEISDNFLLNVEEIDNLVNITKL